MAPVDNIGSFSNPQRQRERRQTKDLMSRTIAVHVCYKSLYIFLPSGKKATWNDQILNILNNVDLIAKFSYFLLK